MTIKKVPVSSLPKECRKRIKNKLPFQAKSFDYWEVQGVSWWGNVTKRNGKRITCGHKHNSFENCAKCVKKMKAERPGKCQTYRATNVTGYYVMYKK
jgi:hypothetical protein